MLTDRPYRGATIILVVLSLVLFSLGLASGLARTPVRSDDGNSTSSYFAGSSAPFYYDRVVTIRFDMGDEEWESVLENATDEEYVKADMWYDGQLLEDVAVRPKGNASLASTSASGSIKLPLKVDINFFNSARNLDGVKKLNLNNGFGDPSFLRESLAYDLFARMGLPTPRVSFVDVWMNDMHLGLYTMVEQIDTSFLKANFSKSNGNLYKPETPGSALNWTEDDVEEETATSVATAVDDINLGGGVLSEIMRALGVADDEDEESTAAASADTKTTAEGSAKSVVFLGADNSSTIQAIQQTVGVVADDEVGYIESMGLTTNENNPDHQALLRLLEVLKDEPDATFQQAIEEVLDVDEVLRYLAVSTVLVHLDNYTGQDADNYYLYEVDGKFTILPWDLNQTFGGYDFQANADGTISFYIDEPTSVPVVERPLVARLLAVPEYLETYHGYLAELIAGPFSSEVMSAKVDELASLISPYVESDTAKLYSMEQFEAGLTGGTLNADGLSHIGSLMGLKDFVTQSIASVASQLAGTQPSRSVDGSGNPG